MSDDARNRDNAVKLLALPGRNPETEAWTTALVSGLSLGQQASEVAHYDHWDTGADPEVDHEAARIHLGMNGRPSWR